MLIRFNVVSMNQTVGTIVFVTVNGASSSSSFPPFRVDVCRMIGLLSGWFLFIIQ